MFYDITTAITVDPVVVAKSADLVYDRAFEKGGWSIDPSTALVALQVSPEFGDRGELQAIELIQNPCSQLLITLLPKTAWENVDPLAKDVTLQYQKHSQQLKTYLPAQLGEEVVCQILQKRKGWQIPFLAVSSGRKCLWSPESRYHAYCDSSQRVAEVISDGRARFYRFIPPGILREGSRRWFQTIRLYFFIHHAQRLVLTVGGVSIEAPTRSLRQARLRAALVH